MTKLAILSTPLQYDRFLQEGFDLKEFEVWCDDERYYDFFESKKVPFRKLEEDLIAEDWEKINTWSCETANRWIAFCWEHEIFSEIDWATVICIVHGYRLAPILKSYHLSKFLLKRGAKYDRAVLFSGQGVQEYPHFSGNACLNDFLELECKKQAIPTIKINLQEGRAQSRWHPETRSFFRVSILPHVKRLLGKLYGSFVKPSSCFDVLAYGSLAHLGSTIAELKKRGLRVALYDFEFHTAQLLFSLKERIPYLLPECFPDQRHFDASQYAQQIADRFDEAFELCGGGELFIYDGVDFKEYVRTHLFKNMHSYFLKSAERINHYRNILSTSAIQSVLVEDDFALKGGVFAGYFNSIGTRVFCNSHANFAVNVSVRKEHCHFHQSHTFVNSTFEKENYIRRGWNAAHLVITGTPRYDRLVAMKERRRGQGSHGRCRILFCGTGLWSFSPDVYGYIGHQKECFGEVQTPALEAVFSAMKDLSVDLIIKPHSFEMLPLWKKLIEQSPLKERIILKKHSDDIFRLLSGCDAMVLAYWSTTLIESAIANRPTIYIDFQRVPNPLLHEYSNKGFCHIVHSESSLREAIQKVCNREYSFFKKPISVETRRYYLGECDAEASERVSDFIREKLGDFPLSQPGQSFRAPDRARS